MASRRTKDWPLAERVLGSDAARAVGRFLPDGPTGYRAATAPDAPLRETRAEAVEDERAALDERELGIVCRVCERPLPVFESWRTHRCKP